MAIATTPALYYIKDLDALRGKLARAERDGTLLGQVWAGVRRRAQAAPAAFPWLTPLVAVVTGAERDLAHARDALRTYVATLPKQQFGMGLQFHFWCFAFPHARWCLYFQWLDALGAWPEDERLRLRQTLIEWQFLNFFYGMRTKPEPECVDNQTLSLCYSNALCGELFGHGPEGSALARRMGADGLRRLPDMLGGFPPSGYSGEGSTYMDHVVGPAIPFTVELLERAHGGDWFSRVLPPNQGSAAAVVRMIAREWLPVGLTLPWDHYGYSLPVRSCIAYGAHRTGDPLYQQLLEQAADWGAETSVGWGFDDLVWTLVWWPGEAPRPAAQLFPNWAEPAVGGAVVSNRGELYAMQMWDESNPGEPSRAHVNPNALVLAAYGSPLTMDGVPAKGCQAFDYPDTARQRTGQNFTPVAYNFGSGCGGAHGVLLVDGWEGLRAMTPYEQGTLVTAGALPQSITGDVTALYAERWPDARRVRRRTRLVGERAWLIDDLAVFAQPHIVTSRWYLRCDQVAAPRGVAIETAEGVRLQLLPLLGPDNPRITRLQGYPERLEGASLQVDFAQQGTVCRWLWLALPQATRRVLAEVADGWTVAPEGDQPWELPAAQAALDQARLRLPFTLPAFMVAEAPLAPVWWYRRQVTPPAGPWWLKLPRGLLAPRLWVDGVELDLAPYAKRQELLPAQVVMPAGTGRPVEIVVRTEVGVCQYGGRRNDASSFYGRPAVLVPAAPPPLQATRYADGAVHLLLGDESCTWAHELLAEKD
jgi:hypothetical protein